MPGRPGALILATLLALTAVPGGAAEFLGAFTWHEDRASHGGFSGIEISANGRRFTALSDRSQIVTGRLQRSHGRITGVDADKPIRLTSRRGEPMTDNIGDSEGLAMAADGGFYIAFEGVPRVWLYRDPAERPQTLPRHPNFDILPTNGALEALAADADGALYTMPERAAGDLPFPVWRFADGVWRLAFTLPDEGFAIVGADFDDKGRLYVLERRFGGVGFASQVRRITLADGRPVAIETLLETRLREHDNLEGIAVWRDTSGAIRLTMISDDNFNWFQRTEIVEYRVPD